ncbi:MAG: hypothetical protein V3V14_00525 [Saprospiraceae bacterium]
MKTLFKLSFFMILLMSCNKETKNDDPNNNEDKSISQTEYDNLAQPCIDESTAIILPASLQIPDNYTQFEQTTLIWSIVQFSNTMRSALSMILQPPSTSFIAEEDGFRVTAGNKGYEWTDGEEKYLYVVEDDGYAIYLFNPGDIIGNLMVKFEQNSDCSNFDYIQYVVKEEEGNKLGDVEFRYEFIQAGTAKIIDFGSDLYSEDSESYRLRSFADSSGELTVRVDGATSQVLLWYPDGSGTYKIIENNTTIDEGTWSF